VPTKYFWQLVAAIIVGVLLALVAQFLFVRLASTLFLFAMGLLVAHLFDPIVNRLRKRGWSRTKSVGFVAVMVIVVFGGLLAWLIPALIGQVEQAVASAPEYSQKATALYTKVVEWATGELSSRPSTAGYVSVLKDQLSGLQDRIGEKVPQLLAWVSGEFLGLLQFAVWLAPLVLISLYFMVVIDDFREGVRDMMPASMAPHVRTIGRQMGALLSQYVRGLATTAITVGIVSALLLGVLSLIFGTRYWLLIGLIAGPLYIVPYLGPAISEVAAGFFGYATAASHPGWAALMSVLALLAVNQAGDVFIMPRIVGRRVGLHPLAILFGILSGYQLFGVVGTMLATPMMVGVKIVLAHWLPLRGGVEVEEAKATGERLDLDWGAAMRHGFDFAKVWGGKAEEAASEAAQKEEKQPEPTEQTTKDE
jgi:predicted PurR-regulated permease PerM